MSDSFDELARERLAKSFAPIFLEVSNKTPHHRRQGHEDLGENSHYQIIIASAAFEGLSKVQRHRAVYDCFREELNDWLHALAIEAYTEIEFKALGP